MQTPDTAPSTEAAVTRVIAFFENLSPADVATIGQFYAPQARFKDPFNEVVGVPAIQGIFAHMFEALEQPRFVVTGRVVQGPQCFLTWDFLFAFKDFHKGVTQTVRGASHLVLDEQGLVSLHRDYWDAAEELYEKLPVVGALMRWLKKRANS
ncbi:nuclear transport factor 2 family protein [Acidovorax sp.]|uniref:nuclear transport factor 2 family protein n=1 Tax=Acidovorax sp. TaxID=1872122 RepID=UPI0025BEE388|nr:nuclear transport factor 2 family protein [Acidovorax sp.]MBW8463869.1 nuclear transport factor 2 family protein [Acidovorax sp.]